MRASYWLTVWAGKLLLCPLCANNLNCFLQDIILEVRLQQPVPFFVIKPDKDFKFNCFSLSELALTWCCQMPLGSLSEILKSLPDFYPLCRSCLQLENKTTTMTTTKASLCFEVVVVRQRLAMAGGGTLRPDSKPSPDPQSDCVKIHLT